MIINRQRTEETNIFNKAINSISYIFIPVINVLMAAALLKAILMLTSNIGLISKTDGAYRILYAASDGFFYFMPMFLAYTASKKLKADTFTSVLIAAALLYPDITAIFENGTGTDFFGLPVSPATYPFGVIPIILAVAFLHYVEIPLEKYLPELLKGFVKPMISVIIVTPVTFLLFGPLGSMVGNSLADAYSALYNFSPVTAGAIFGFLWQPMVVFGLHWGLVPVIIDNINTLGVDSILPLLGPAVMGQAGAALAVSIISKNKKLKTIAMSGFVTAVLGTTEPVLYGVTIPLKRPMIAACIAGAIGGGIVGTSHAGAISFAFPSLLTLVVYFGKGFWTYLMALIAGFLMGFVLTFLFRFREQDYDPETKIDINALQQHS